MMMVTDEDGKGDNVNEDDTDEGVDDEANGNEGGDGYGERRLEEGDDNSGDFDEDDDVNTPPRPALRTTITASRGWWREMKQPSSAEEDR
nr:hypothetical protein BaRGS_003662 [Batillaria attramentaria]